uniref:UNC93-like protein 3 n=1 Tax=Anthurium amnicola TaxID=1678845 RepID=A0A1D1Z9J3_9ARAE
MDTREGEEAPFVVNVSAPVEDGSPSGVSPRRGHARDVHILSFAFLFIFSAYGAAQNLQSTVNTEHDLGTTSMGILYLSFTLFSLVAPPMVRVLGSKNALLLGTTGYWLFIASNLKPSWYTLLPASLYLGYTASIIWVGQGTYLTSAARSHAKDCHLHEGTVIGNFNGEFWGMFASTQVIGNLVTLALLGGGKCSLIAGRLTSGLSSITLIVSGGAFLQTLILLWLLLKYSLTSGVLGYLYPLLMAAVWGIGDGVFNTQLNALLGMLFRRNTEAAFAQLKVWQSASTSLVFFLSPHITFQAMSVGMIITLLVSVSSFLFLTLHVENSFARGS